MPRALQKALCVFLAGCGKQDGKRKGSDLNQSVSHNDISLF